ncbi:MULTISPECIES: phosphatidate cytidylyltransferase [unclassified Frigoribacterium]|uniref:phosphatidate cytidylyltransferase n=1 Tax=unclassified Frigoribacterium TaxID=2627005 RepID=UPI000F469F44|nr:MULTISPECIES: phosphatidate cytidylyltransferase [unclassified Frigoribacterium]ROP78099.1 phosphatidate cytidylyltransferase [Frigoribacterium sp. PhB107]TDT65941.1 phosphatidate cytidylyltransferase [Frigoribacterium sp. PhB116]
MSDAPDGARPDESVPTPKTTLGSRRADFDARAQAARHDLENQIRSRRAQLGARNEKLTARTGRNLPAAIAVGVGLGAAVLLSLIFEPAFFMIVAGALIGSLCFELTSALRFAGRDVPRLPSVLVGLAMVPLSFVFGVQGQWLGLVGGVLVVSLWRVAELVRPSHRKPASVVWRDIGAGAFVQIYCSFLGSFMLVLAAEPNGANWTLATLIIVIAVDTGAYATGLNFGKHPMAPRISPKKTWEGFAGSVAASLIAAVLTSWLMLDEPWWFGFVLGGVIIVTATIGDLSESLIKRDLGIKDISTWLPGHGGFLDRLDSTLPSAAAAYALYLLVT